MLHIGDPAPDFTLFDTERQATTLSALKGSKVVLLFFPFAFTSTCTAELCATRDDIAFYQNLNAQVFGISVDSPFTLAEFKAQQKLNFPLLSDFNKTVSEAYDALYETFTMQLLGVSRRAAFVVNEAGNIIYAEVLESAGSLPNFEAVKAAVSSGVA